MGSGPSPNVAVAPALPVATKRKSSTTSTVLIVVGAVVGLFLLVGVIGALAGGGDDEDEGDVGGSSDVAASGADGVVEDAEALYALLTASGFDCPNFESVEPSGFANPPIESAGECNRTGSLDGMRLQVYGSEAEAQSLIIPVEECEPGQSPFSVFVLGPNWAIFQESSAADNGVATNEEVAAATGFDAVVGC